MYEYSNKSKPTQTTLHEVFRGCQIHLRSIIGRRCCISVRQYPKQRVYLQIFLHDQGCVIHLVVNLGCFCGRKKKQRSISFKPFSAHFRKWACIKDGFQIDDGYSGTTFERPDWKRLTESRERTC